MVFTIFIEVQVSMMMMMMLSPPTPGNSNGVQDRVFKVPGNNVSNEDSGTQAPVTYNQQSTSVTIHALFSHLPLTDE